MKIYYSLFINAKFSPAVIERILRVVRHRGFELNTLDIFPCGNNINNKQINIHLTVSSNRAIYLLYTQLNKLIDVDHVEIQ